MALGNWLASVGVSHLITMPGVDPLPGVPGLAVLDADCAALLAQAQAAYGAGMGAVWDGEVLTLLCPPALLPRRDGRQQDDQRQATRRGDPKQAGKARGPGRGEVIQAPDPAALVAAVAAARAAGAGELRVRPLFDPAADLDPADLQPGAPAADLPDGPLAVDLILAGSGVARAGAAGALRELAERTGLGVLTTFAVPALLGPAGDPSGGPGGSGRPAAVGIQEHDLRLAGVGPDSVVLAVGLDAGECPPAVLRAAGLDPARNIRAVSAAELVRLAEAGMVRPRPARLAGAGSGADRAGGASAPLADALADILGPLYEQDGSPLNPARAAADVAAVLPDHGVVLAEPGPAALWVARAMPAPAAGTVRVAPAGDQGVAIAGALLAGLRGELGVAVVDTPPAGTATTLLALASSLDVGLVVTVWGRRGGLRSAADHRERLATALRAPGVSVIEVPVDQGHTKLLTDLAGDVVAW